MSEEAVKTNNYKSNFRLGLPPNKDHNMNFYMKPAIYLVIGILLLAMVNLNVGINDAGERTVIQYPWGTLVVKFTPAFTLNSLVAPKFIEMSSHSILINKMHMVKPALIIQVSTSVIRMAAQVRCLVKRGLPYLMMKQP